ncbi:hypothetical protein BX661DRAFT_98784 [Kickxella alabastrina]|uniref:uncharacterized protein n=1 Tax=Kickxella alabastrina TaxID=61397 RepID=UPI002220092C|nr:uncharacterized protein BX661DRAFT_98784 [Kickxella alabastrina]KAI7819117.1 hypothetical protein BX661DRAFT_98784 [Kickxella alabastrina]
MDRPSSDQHARIRDAVSIALATKPLAAAQDAFIKFPSATDDTSDQLQSTMRRFRSLSVNTRERAAWSEDTVKRKYPMDKTVELYQFSSVFETADLNQILEPYQHHRCERGGYRLKWLDEARALAVFRRAETVLFKFAIFPISPARDRGSERQPAGQGQELFIQHFGFGRLQQKVRRAAPQPAGGHFDRHHGRALADKLATSWIRCRPHPLQVPPRSYYRAA